MRGERNYAASGRRTAVLSKLLHEEEKNNKTLMTSPMPWIKREKGEKKPHPSTNHQKLQTLRNVKTSLTEESLRFYHHSKRLNC